MNERRAKNTEVVIIVVAVVGLTFWREKNNEISHWAEK